LLKPSLEYEGFNFPKEKSRIGMENKFVNQVRDPGIFINKNDKYLFNLLSDKFNFNKDKIITKRLANFMFLKLIIIRTIPILSILAAKIKSFSESPLIACVVISIFA